MSQSILSLSIAALVAACLPAASVQDDVGPSPRPGPPPGTYVIEPTADSIRIPFEVCQGEIRLLGHVNGREARILIDNGSLWDQLLFFGSPRVDALGMERAGNIHVGGAGSGDPILADLASGISLGFEGENDRTIEFFDQTGVIMPYEPGKPNPWAVAEGQVSSALFKHFVVCFDFDAGLMTLIRPEAFDPKDRGTELPLRPIVGSSWTVPGAITLHDDRRLEVDLMMDLGWDEPLGINTGQAHGIETPSGLEKRVLGSGAQGAIYGHLGTVPVLEIGGFTLRDPLATYSTVEDGGAKDSEVMVGLGVFQRFHVVFDYPRHRLYLQPNRRFADPFAK